jgi:hypothetical protein
MYHVRRVFGRKRHRSSAQTWLVQRGGGERKREERFWFRERVSIASNPACQYRASVTHGSRVNSAEPETRTPVRPALSSFGALITSPATSQVSGAMKPGGRRFTGQKARVVLGSRHGQCSEVTIENDDCLSLSCSNSRSRTILSSLCQASTGTCSFHC